MSNKDYNKMSTKKADVEPNEIENTTTPEPVVEEPKAEPVKGIVANCSKLNVRTEPSKDADVLEIVKENTKVLIDTNESTDDWYKVDIKLGKRKLSGFCMKKYIEVK